jgi:hypothetical protein
MKMKTSYELWIAYADKWFNLNRLFDDYNIAREVASRIAEEHKPTTRIAIVTVILKKETSLIYRGTNLEKPKNFYKYCKSCGNKKASKNINGDGDCLACATRKELNKA